MALASQMSRSDRPTGSWGMVSGRRRRRGRGRRGGTVVLLAGVAAIGAGVWGLTKLLRGSELDAEGQVAEAAAAGTFEQQPPAPEGLATPLPASPEERRPTQLTQGTAERAAQEALTAPAAGSAAAQPLAAAPPASTARAVTPTAINSDPLPALKVAPPARPAAQSEPQPSLPGDVAASVAAADRAWKENRLVEARTLLNRALLDPRTSEADRAALRAKIAELNNTLVFSPTVYKADPLAESYTIQSGDSLARITTRMGLGVDWRLIQRINRISNPNRISVGQKIKIIRGPFHAVVDKSDFRIDIYAGEPVSASAASRPGRSDGVEPGWIYIRSFRVGLGEHGTTPLGTFVVRPRSKLINPSWKNPRTGEEFAADDPKNPIGEHWLGLEGLDEATKAFQGYGIHGTVEPESIGKEMSMGCVRLAADDVALVYEMLEEGISIVRIVP